MAQQEVRPVTAGSNASGASARLANAGQAVLGTPPDRPGTGMNDTMMDTGYGSSVRGEMWADHKELLNMIKAQEKDSVKSLFSLVPPGHSSDKSKKKSTAHAMHGYDQDYVDILANQDKTHRHKRNFYTEFADLQCREKYSARGK